MKEMRRGSKNFRCELHPVEVVFVHFHASAAEAVCTNLTKVR
jgi:hypothetical protein